MNPSSKGKESVPKTDPDGPLSFEKVWFMFQETQKAMAKQAEETDRKFQETDQRFKEAAEQIKETSREITRLERQFTSMWGKLVESLVRGDLI